MDTKARLALLSGFVLPALISPATSAAGLILVGSVGACETTDFGCPPPLDGFNLSGTTTLSGAASGTRTDQLSHAGTVSVAQVGYGWFRAAVTADISGDARPGGATTSFVSASSADQFVINPVNPTLISTVGVMTFSVQIAGSLAAQALSPESGYAIAYWSMSAATDFGNPALVNAQLATPPQPSYGDASGSTYVLTLPIVFGQTQALNLGYELQSQAWDIAFALTAGTASAAGQFANTFRWLGISSVTDQNGVPVAFSVASESGTDWSQAAVVPLPTAAWLFASAAALLGITTRRRLSRTLGT